MESEHETQIIVLEWNLSNPDTNGAEESVVVSEVSSFQVEMQARVVLGVGKGVLFRGVLSSVQECHYREKGSTHMHTAAIRDLE